MRRAASNPVTRAFEKQRLGRVVRDQKIRIYLTADGEPCLDFAPLLGSTLAVLAFAAELDPFIRDDNPELIKVRQGVDAFNEMSATGRFIAARTELLDHALSAALELKTAVREAYLLKAETLIRATPSELAPGL